MNKMKFISVFLSFNSFCCCNVEGKVKKTSNVRKHRKKVISGFDSNFYRNVCLGAKILAVPSFLVVCSIVGSLIFKCDKTIKNDDDKKKGGNKNNNSDNIKTQGNFEKRELEWIKFLCGDDAKGFRFKNSQDFREANDEELEEYHDYIQVIFPNLEASAYSNNDLFLKKKVKEWKEMLSDNSVRSKIQSNVNLNLIRMLKFWKFNISVGDDKKITISGLDSNSVLLKKADHNQLRFTRVLHCLKLFGLNEEYGIIISEMEKHKTQVEKEAYNFWEGTKNTKCLF